MNKKFYSFLAIAAVAAMMPFSTLADWYICSQAHSGWTPANAEAMTPVGDGIYTFDLKDASFKLSTVRGSWNDFNSNAYTGTMTTVGTAVEFTKGDANSTINVNFLKSASGYKIQWDENTHMMTLTEIIDPVYGFLEVYLRGGMNGWNAEDDWKFNTTDGVNYTLENVNITAGTTFKIGGKDWAGAVNFGGVTNMLPNTDYELFYNSSDCSTASNMDDCTVTFNLNTHVIRFDTEGDITIIHPATLYMFGQVNGSAWNPTNYVAMESTEEGVYSAVNVEIGDANGGLGDEAWGYFSFAEGVGVDENDWAGLSTRYGATENDFLVTLDSLETLVYGENAFKIAPDTYDFTVDLNKMQICVSKNTTGVENLQINNSDAPAEYYNLQGVRVANPAAGIYVVRQAGKTRKVAIR